MSEDEIIHRLEEAVQLVGDDAAIRIWAEYEPLAGREAKVFPPSYLGPTYHLEARWDEQGERADVCVLDSYQSQANRVEAALKSEALDLGLPQLILEADVVGEVVRISNFDAPHRSRDAYFVDSELDGQRFDATDLGKSLALVRPEHATPALKHVPGALVFGVWDSHRGKRIATKFPRAYTSEGCSWRAQTRCAATVITATLITSAETPVVSQRELPKRRASTDGGWRARCCSSAV